MTTNEIQQKIRSLYSEKQQAALTRASYAKERIYERFPDLKKKDEEINILSVSRAKACLLGNLRDANICDEKLELKQRERTLFLSEHNISESFDRPVYECDKCSDTGYITNDYKSVKCSCLINMENRLYGNVFGIDPIGYKFFNDIEYNIFNEKELPAYKRNVSIAENFVEHFEEESTKNLLFTGPTGTGKTFLATCIYSEICRKGHLAVFKSAPNFFDIIYEYKSSRFSKKPADPYIYKTLYSAPLLIIDDLGTESSADGKFIELLNLLNERKKYNGSYFRKTVVSTNLTPKNLFSFYDERIASRLLGNDFMTCGFTGSDIRFKSLLKE